MYFNRALLLVAFMTPATLAGPREDTLHRRTGDDDKDKDSSSSANLLPTGRTPSPSLIPSLLPSSSSYGTAGVDTPESTVAILTTEVVYVTLTTCPVTNTVTSGTQAFEEVTTTTSTVTRTSISTICTKCVAPPRTKTSAGFTSVEETLSFTPLSSIIYPLTQPSAGLSFAASMPETFGTGTAPTPSVVSSTASSLSLSGYAIVPSPTIRLGDKGPLSNATTSVIPVFPPSMLGNGYGGGFVSTPSVYVTKLPFPNGPSEGVPPGYGFSSQPETNAGTSSGLVPISSSIENSTSPFTSLPLPPSLPTTLFTGPGLPSSTAFHVGNVTYQVSLAAATASLLSSVLPIVNVSLISATTYTSFLGGPSSTASAVIVEGSDFGFAVIGPQGSASEVFGAEATNAANAITFAVSVIGNQEQTSLPTSSVNMPISMGANGSPIFASTSSEFLSNVPAVLVTHAATSGEVIVGTSNPAPSLISSTASDSQLVVTASTPAPVLVSQTASSGQVIIEISTPPGIFINPISVSNTSLVLGSPIAIGVVGSPLSTPGQIFSTPVTVAAGSSPDSGTVASSSIAVISETPLVGADGLTSFSVASVPIEQTSAVGQPGATILTPVVGANGLTSLVVVAPPISQPATTVSTPNIGANGLASLPGPQIPVEQTVSLSPPASTVLTPVMGFNGMTSLAVVPSPVVGANGLTSLAVFSTPVAAASGLESPAVILTPVIGANGLTSLAVLATPVLGANGLTSLAIRLQAQQGTSGIPSLIEETIAVPIIPTAPVLGSLYPSLYPTQGVASDSNSSVRVPLSPSTVPFEGSALKLSMRIGVCLMSFIMVLIVL